MTDNSFGKFHIIPVLSATLFFINLFMVQDNRGVGWSVLGDRQGEIHTKHMWHGAMTTQTLVIDTIN